MSIKKQACLLLFLFLIHKIQSQESNDSFSSSVLSFQEFMGFVKKHHPLVKQAELKLKKGEAYLLKARGGFDPKLEVDYIAKELKKTNYFKELYAAFKLPTWYGIEFKAAFEDNEGVFLNPNLTTPDDGLYSVGVTVPIGKGLFINERMASLKKARFFKNQTKYERDVAVNELLYKASVAYFSWLEAYNKEEIYKSFVKNSEVRLAAVEESVKAGDKPLISVTESKINLQNRKLELEEATRKRKVTGLKVNNYLWVNSVPLELVETTVPTNPKHIEVENSLLLVAVDTLSNFVDNHPKLKGLGAKIDGLEVDLALKKNKLLPKLNLNYNFLSEDVSGVSSFKTSNYKGYIDFSFPLFLRKERGDVRLSKLKLADANFKRMSEELKIKNKIEEAQINIQSIYKQQSLIEKMIEEYIVLVKAEERKFILGESSIFLINYREEKLIQSKLKGNSLRVKSLKSKAALYNSLGTVL